MSYVTHTHTCSRLFQHFFVAFAHIFGCSDPPPSPPSTGGTPSLAYVHKYMNLNFTDLGHFIDQLTQATVHFGFSAEDSQTLSTNLNSMYNVRCAPPVTTNPAQGPQLYSLCQADTCPLAEPNPDCAAYVNLTANGLPGGVTTAPLSTSTQVPTSTSTPAGAATTTSAASGQSTTPLFAGQNVSSSLSPGGFAGIILGSIAFICICCAIGTLIWKRRVRNRRRSAPPPVVTLPPKHEYSPYSSGGKAVAELESPRLGHTNVTQVRSAASPVSSQAAPETSWGTF